MFSVTGRVKYVDQPRGGYVSQKLIIEKNFEDGEVLSDLDSSSYYSIQGMVVDYLTRVMFGTPKQEAFAVSLNGAALIGELARAEKLLDKINGMDRDSIVSACKLVCYDVFLRKDLSPLGKSDLPVSEEMINNITIMVKRCKCFFELNGPVILDGFVFPGAYNAMISSGDGDFLTKDTLWDFKAVRKRPDKNHTLQLLVYYILGLHSTHSEFEKIKKLGIFNPLLNATYEIYVSDIDDETFQKVSREVIGYCTPDDAKQWKNAYGISLEAEKEIRNIIANQNVDTAFSLDNYSDGIHDITKDDYWTYCRKLYGGERPKIAWAESLKLVKNSGFSMFVGITKKGEIRLLKKGDKRVLDKPIEYYYCFLSQYGNAVLTAFSKYWDTLHEISKFILSIKFDEKDLRKYCSYWIKDAEKQDKIFEKLKFKKMISREFTGIVHGCIVDIDFYNHIFLNPNDGSIVPYFSNSKDDLPEIYKNVEDLIARRRPEMFPAFLRNVYEYSNKEVSLLIESGNKKICTKIDDNENAVMNEEFEKRMDNVIGRKMMYSYSRKIGELKSVYDYRCVQVWYDDFLSVKPTKMVEKIKTLE